MHVFCQCMYLVNVCFWAMHVPGQCMYLANACAWPMHVSGQCMYLASACICMYFPRFKMSCFSYSKLPGPFSSPQLLNHVQSFLVVHPSHGQFLLLLQIVHKNQSVFISWSFVSQLFFLQPFCSTENKSSFHQNP